MGDAATLYSPLIAVLGIVASIVIARYTKKSQDKSNDTGNWSEMFKANEVQFARLNKNVEDLNVKVDRLEAELQMKDKQLWYALTYIRDLVGHWFTQHPGEEVPGAPEAIKDLI